MASASYPRRLIGCAEDSLVGAENAPCDTEQVRDVVEYRVWDLAGVYCLTAHHPVPVQRCVSPYSAVGVAASWFVI